MPLHKKIRGVTLKLVLFSLVFRMLMPDLMPEDQFKILVDGRLYLSTLGISLTSIPRQYCIEDVVNNGERIYKF